MRFACGINNATETVRIYNIYCSSTASMLRHTYIAWLVLVIYRRIKLSVSKSVTANTSQLRIHSFIHSFILQSVLRQVHSLFQSDFSTKCDLVLPLFKFQYPLFSLRAPSSYLGLLPRLPVTSVFPSLSNNKVLQKTVPTHDVNIRP